jgi:hypothetical protein
MLRSLRSQKHNKVPSHDGRSADARLLRKTRAELTAHCGGKPSATQLALIDRAAMLTLHVSKMDLKAVEAGEFTQHASNQYLAWSNALSRTLAKLGLEGSKPAKADPFELIRAIHASHRPTSEATDAE